MDILSGTGFNEFLREVAELPTAGSTTYFFRADRIKSWIIDSFNSILGCVRTIKNWHFNDFYLIRMNYALIKFIILSVACEKCHQLQFLISVITILISQPTLNSTRTSWNSFSLLRLTALNQVSFHLM